MGDELPWHYSLDLQIFKLLTLHNLVIVGRRTHSIIKHLPLRYNYVVSRALNTSIEGGIKLAKELNVEPFIIGGEQIYKWALEENLVTKIYATEIKREVEGDKFFPELVGWRRTVCVRSEEFDVVVHDRFRPTQY